MDNREAASVLARVAWMRKKLTELEEEAKRHLDLQPGERAMAVLPNGIQVGYVAEVGGAKTIIIEDETRFAEWVAERWPTEVVTAVRKSFLAAKKEAIHKLGALLDPATGEVCPYLSVGKNADYAKVTLDVINADVAMMALASNMPLGQLITLELEEKNDHTENTSGEEADSAARGGRY